MEKDLKAQNLSSLTAIYLGAFVLLAMIHWSVEEVFEVSARLAQQTFVVAAVTSFSAVLSNILPNYVKHPLVYFRIRNVLSGHRCKHICLKDPRLFSADLDRKWPELFLQNMKESEQNAYWYKKIYRPVRNSPEVLQSHRSFLLFRDAASGLFILLVGLWLWRALAEWISFPSLGVSSLVILAGVILVLCQAARQSGDRMVANAVAVALVDEDTTRKRRSKED